jgi:hypothetical protein
MKSLTSARSTGSASRSCGTARTLSMNNCSPIGKLIDSALNSWVR